MYPWRVLVEGTGVWIEIDGDRERRGFYVIRFVEAEDEEGARRAAVEQVMETLDETPGGTSSITAIEVEAVADASEVPDTQPGFAFYDADAEDDDEPFEPSLPVDESFELARGCSLTDRGGLSEGFDVVDSTGDESTRIFINVSADRLALIYRELTELVVTPGFFIVETASRRAVEQELRESDDDPFHVDVHYLDDVEPIDHRILFDRLADLLTSCGMVAFGFGSHEFLDEVTVDGFKVVMVQTIEPKKYVDCLRRLRFERRSPLRTAWDTLGEETPGDRSLVRIEGRTVYDVVEELGERGLYFARRREGTV